MSQRPENKSEKLLSLYLDWHMFCLTDQSLTVQLTACYTKFLLKGQSLEIADAILMLLCAVVLKIQVSC